MWCLQLFAPLEWTEDLPIGWGSYGPSVPIPVSVALIFRSLVPANRICTFSARNHAVQIRGRHLHHSFWKQKLQTCSVLQLREVLNISRCAAASDAALARACQNVRNCQWRQFLQWGMNFTFPPLPLSHSAWAWTCRRDNSQHRPLQSWSPDEAVQAYPFLNDLIYSPFPSIYQCGPS